MGGKGSGRPKTIDKLISADHQLKQAAPAAAKYLIDCATRQNKQPSWLRARISMFIIEQVLGKAPMRHEILGADGNAMTIQGLALILGSAEKQTEDFLLGKTDKPPATPDFIDVTPEEISEKAAVETPEKEEKEKTS